MITGHNEVMIIIQDTNIFIKKIFNFFSDFADNFSGHFLFGNNLKEDS